MAKLDRQSCRQQFGAIPVLDFVTPSAADTVDNAGNNLYVVYADGTNGTVDFEGVDAMDGGGPDTISVTAINSRAAYMFGTKPRNFNTLDEQKVALNSGDARLAVIKDEGGFKSSNPEAKPLFSTDAISQANDMVSGQEYVIPNAGNIALFFLVGSAGTTYTCDVTGGGASSDSNRIRTETLTGTDASQPVLMGYYANFDTGAWGGSIKLNTTTVGLRFIAVDKLDNTIIAKS